MTFSRRRLLAAGLVGASSAAVLRPAGAVIVLDSTWRAEGGRPGHESEGFGAHIALAHQPQFKGVIAMSDDGGGIWGNATGTWMGNVDGHARILTAAHVFNKGGPADYYVYRAPSGAVLHGRRVTYHPLYNWDNAERTGYDFAVVELNRPITDAGTVPALYGGTREMGQQVVMVGYGSRGIGSVGQQPIYYEGSDRAAATNVVDEVMNAVHPVPRGKEEDAGNWLRVTLRRESQGAGRLDGILGSGDSGGSTWLRAGDGWAICGINSNGTGDTYGSPSYFARISGVRDWLIGTIPGLNFVT
jgi:hypothetical protein